MSFLGKLHLVIKCSKSSVYLRDSDGSGSNFPSLERVRVVVFLNFQVPSGFGYQIFLTSGFGYLFSTCERVLGIIYEVFD